MITTTEQIHQRLRDALDLDRLGSIYRQMNYAFGKPWESKYTGSTAGEGEFPDYADIIADALKVGESRRILNSQYISLSRVMYSNPKPEFPQVDKYTGEARKQFWGARARAGEWSTELAHTYMEGDGLGTGFLQIGTEETKLGKKVAMRHSPSIMTLFDRLERNLGHIQFICFVQYLRMDLAEDIFGKDTAKLYAKDMWDGRTGTNKQQVVRMFEYFDLGWGKDGDPTRAVILGNMSNEPVERKASPYEKLPFSYYTHFYAPGMRYPTGRIVLQMSTQQAINELEASLRKIVKEGTGTDILDAEQLHPDDVNAMARGEIPAYVRMVNPNPGVPPVLRIESQEVSAALLQLLNVYERQYNADSGTTEFDRGNLAAQSRTLGENQLVDQRSQMQGLWPKKQVAEFYRRTVEMVNYVAGLGDTEPVTLDIFGNNIPINAPGIAASSISAFLQEPSLVLIDEDDLTVQDTFANQARRMGQLQAVLPLVGQTVDPVWYTKEVLRAMGEEDPSEAMISQQQALPNAGPMGTPPGTPMIPQPQQAQPAA